MKTKTKITGIAICSVPVYLVNHKVDFKYDSEKNEISTNISRDIIESLLKTSGFTDEMIQF